MPGRQGRPEAQDESEPQGKSETITSTVRLMAVAIKIAGSPIGVSSSGLAVTFALDTPPVKIEAVLMPTG